MSYVTFLFTRPFHLQHKLTHTLLSSTVLMSCLISSHSVWKAMVSLPTAVFINIWRYCNSTFLYDYLHDIVKWFSYRELRLYLSKATSKINFSFPLVMALPMKLLFKCWSFCEFERQYHDIEFNKGATVVINVPNFVLNSSKLSQ